MNGGASQLVPAEEGTGRRRRAWVAGGTAAAIAIVAVVAGFAFLADDGPSTAPAPADATIAPAPVEPPTTTAAPTTVPTTTSPPTTVDLSQPPGPYTGPTTLVPLAPGYAGLAEVATAAVPTVSAYAEPLARPWPVMAAWTFPQSTLFGTPTAFLVSGYGGGDWLKVVLPMKPNGTEGWVHRSEVTVTSTDERLIVDVGQRQVQLFAGDRLLATSSAVVGKDSTPTPTGTYFVTDLLRTDEPDGVYGPYILATSARSDAFDFFNGGEPIVALHGTNQPSLIGSAASNGCVRLPNEVSTQLASLTPVGAPVYII
jgi:lipoprotein-anchoring transpeptidase ErfK/SrfK